MGSTLERSFLKGICWEFFGFLITLFIAYIYYGNFPESIGFAVFLTVIKIPLFFINERIWKTIRWGKIREDSLYKNDKKIKKK